MKKATKHLLILTMTFVFSMSFAQNSYTIQFQDEIIEVPENIDSFQWSQMPDYSRLDNVYYGWIQFYETPTQEVQDLFKTLNLQLLEYIPHRTYLFSFPENTSVELLRENGVRAIVPVDGRVKLSTPLKNPPYANYAMEEDNILVTLQHHNSVNTQTVINDLAVQLQITVQQQYQNSNILELSIPNNCLESLSNLPYVKWVELIGAPPVKEDTRGRSLHRASNLDTQTASGRNYTGQGVGVMVRDDGAVGPHIDFEGRITGLMGNNGSNNSHGDGVAGILTGAGNLDPSKRGMAAGSDLYVVNYSSTFLDSSTTTAINNGTSQITNSSYGDGCNDGYTSKSQTVDTQINTVTSLLHVFSCGNSGSSNCGYGAGSGWGNITGGHKQAKNVIATANVFFDGSLVNSSSRGPATDGRIKPDIAANGQNQGSTNNNNTYQSFGGTSGASPGIAGVSAQLYQAYMDANGGTLPQSALIKGTLLNTASDYGNVGPDFKFGWGIVNGLRAGMLIEDGRYLSDDISQGDTNNHSITIPSGTTQVRFMVYWNDPAATAGANPALVNDLDLLVNDPVSIAYLPWILDPTPNPATLDLPATNGADHLNNMEQVVINDPMPGSYDIEISGFNVPMGPQEYFVLYEVVTENLTLTYPNGGESFHPFVAESIHWDAINTTADFDLEYSTDNGTTWNAIATVPAGTTNYAWTTENEITGEALIRISSGTFEDTSDDTFNIARYPNILTVVEVCPTETTLEWSPIDDAESYDVYMLGDMYMEVVGTSPTESITLPITDPAEPFWFAVVAKNATEGWQSRRSNAKNHPGGLFNCLIGIDENELASAISLYPNPASNEVTVTFNNTLIDSIDVSIVNSLGQVLQRIEGGNSSASIDVSNYSTGLYFVTITSEGVSTTKKLVVY